MKIEFHEQMDAMYIRLREGTFKENEVIDDTIVIDKDENGNVLGIELVGIVKKIPGQQPLKHAAPVKA